MRDVFSFPATVNEKAARVVAGCVMVIALVALATGWTWLLAVLAAGFVARVVAGPSLSPLAQFATRVAAPRLGPPKNVSGPPKRFAQAMGAAMSTAGAVLALVFGVEAAAYVFAALIVVAATLESAFGLCIGCRVFAGLMRLGLIPEETCEACADIWRRPAVPE